MPYLVYFKAVSLKLARRGVKLMNSVTFYDVKKRQKVDVPVSECWKRKYERTTKDGSVQVRYAVRARVDGTNLTKFVSKADWDALSCPEKDE